MLTTTLSFDPATRAFVAAVSGLPSGTGCVALYANRPGEAAQLLGAVAPAAGASSTEVRVAAGADGLYRLKAYAYDAFNRPGQPAPVLLDAGPTMNYQVTLTHTEQLSQLYAAHAAHPRPPGASLAQYLKAFARLSEAMTVYQEGDLYHAHQYLQTP